MKKFIVALFLFAFFISASAETAPPAKASTCVACHGPDVNSSNPIWPNLAGQHEAYLKKQLLDIKAGKTRTAPLMAAIVAGLSNQDIDELSSYYAHQKLAQGKVPQRYLKRGEVLYRGGDFKEQVTACIACHGPNGTGNGQAGFPVLSGQQAPYTLQQLKAFKLHERHNDLNSIMQDISGRMDEADMEAVAYYVQGLH